MASSSEVSVGQNWAYRARESDPLVKVRVLALSEQSPRRARVAFMVGPLVSAEEWVPLGRLKTSWAESDAFSNAETRWRALSSFPDEVEADAVHAAVELLFQGTAEIGLDKLTRGTISILNAVHVDETIGGGLPALVANVDCIEDDRGAHYGWSIAVAIARRACRHSPQRVLSYIQTEGSNSARLNGRAEVQQHLDLLREWCSKSETSSNGDWLSDGLEVARFKELFESAVALIYDAGDELGSRAIYAHAFPGATDVMWRELIQRHVEGRRLWRETNS